MTARSTRPTRCLESPASHTVSRPIVLATSASRRTTQERAAARIELVDEPARIRFLGYDGRRLLQQPPPHDVSRLRSPLQSTDNRLELSPSWSGIPAASL